MVPSRKRFVINSAVEESRSKVNKGDSVDVENKSPFLWPCRTDNKMGGDFVLFCRRRERKAIRTDPSASQSYGIDGQTITLVLALYATLYSSRAS
jgi:hypothetical protein